ncbi:unnamed protein product [Vicia faba]|uniref:Uncharacterized protein n=1 Tax=Vicia faba TaxID=3906 RepID=A0AAV0ZAZ0_VICFA|nr:unnamed protein product [Vicia faba]
MENYSLSLSLNLQLSSSSLFNHEKNHKNSENSSLNLHHFSISVEESQPRNSRKISLNSLCIHAPFFSIASSTFLSRRQPLNQSSIIFCASICYTSSSSSVSQ